MQFNSEIFIFLFLPFTFFGFHFLKNRVSNTALVWWLIICSGLFYSWFSVKYLIMIYFSAVINYLLCIYIIKKNKLGKSINSLLLISGIFINLLPLIYFKYTNFIVFNLDTIAHFTIHPFNLILPLGISFFTFHNIIYLIDSYYGRAQQYPFANYILYVLFFPQLIAGPIVLYSEFMPQIEKLSSNTINQNNIMMGISLFLMGLIKKIIFSDYLAHWADPLFQAAAQGQGLGFGASWFGIIAFTLQLYFDFSGYTDMALGLAMMLGIILPANFDSPFKANNIIEFWQRWHITLSRFFQSYIFIPLAMKYHKKQYGIYLSVLFTMLMSGLWHGAAWNFILWGGFHGVLLCINHLWRRIYSKAKLNWNDYLLWRIMCVLLTNVSFAVSLIFFRSSSVQAALLLFKNISHFSSIASSHLLGHFHIKLLLAASLLTLIWILPNSQTLCGIKKEAAPLGKQLSSVLTRISSTYVYAILIAMAIGSIILYQGLRLVSLKTFIYFQF